MGRAGMLVVLLLTACTKHNPEACCTTAEDCAAKGLPEGTACDVGFTCSNNTCIPPITCQAASDCTDALPLCNTTTGMCAACLSTDDCATGICDIDAGTCRGCADDSECASGYCDVSSGDCGLNVPDWKYVPDACDTASSTDLSITTSMTLDTSIDGTCQEIRTQSDGPELCILHYRNVACGDTATVRIKGKRALAIIADENFAWDGTLDIAADPSPYLPDLGTSGPGGGWSVFRFASCGNSDD